MPPKLSTLERRCGISLTSDQPFGCALAAPDSAAETLPAIIFDLDGMLADTERDGHRFVFNQAQLRLWHLYAVSEAVT